MEININVKRKFIVNGKEYNSIEEMPDDIREAFENASVSQSYAGSHTHSQVQQTRIVFNGREYENIDSMPKDIRGLYENVLKAAETGTASQDIDRASISSSIISETTRPYTGNSADKRQPTKFESFFSLRVLVAIAALAALLLVIGYLLHVK